MLRANIISKVADRNLRRGEAIINSDSPSGAVEVPPDTAPSPPLFKYIYTGIMHKEFRVTVREGCYRCGGRAYIIVKKVSTGKTKRKGCKCVRFIEDLPINWVFLPGVK